MNLKKVALIGSVLISGIALVPAKSEAAIFNIPGYGQYDITYVYTNYDDPVIAAQPWYSGKMAAVDFANAVGPSLGAPNVPPVAPPGYILGPYFAYIGPDGGQDIAYYDFKTGTVVEFDTIDPNNNNGYRYLAEDVPEPQNILGATTGLAFFGLASAALKRKKASK